jgi:hypothetical protein
VCDISLAPISIDGKKGTVTTCRHFSPISSYCKKGTVNNLQTFLTSIKLLQKRQSEQPADISHQHQVIAKLAQ